MASESSGREHGCSFHFEGKSGGMREFTVKSFATFMEKRSEWLKLPYDYKCFSTVARKSLTFIPEILTFEELPSQIKFHLSCYRLITDSTKLTRAMNVKNTIKLTTDKETAPEETVPKRKEEPRKDCQKERR